MNTFEIENLNGQITTIETTRTITFALVVENVDPKMPARFYVYGTTGAASPTRLIREARSLLVETQTIVQAKVVEVETM